ncbi:hypothetical protein HKD37_07G018091 [Glycine soja]
MPRGSSLCEGMGEGYCTQPYPCICKEAVSGFEPMTNKSPRHNFTAAPGLALVKTSYPIAQRLFAMRKYGGGILYAALPLHMQRSCFRIRTHDQQVLKADCWVGIHSFLVAKVRLQRESEACPPSELEGGSVRGQPPRSRSTYKGPVEPTRIQARERPRSAGRLVTMDVTKQDSIPHVSDSFGTSGPQSSVSVTEKLIVAMPRNVVLFQNLAMLMHFSTRMKVWDSLKLLLWAGKFYGVLSTSSFGKREIQLSSIMPCLTGIVFLRPDPSFQVSFVQYSGFSEF